MSGPMIAALIIVIIGTIIALAHGQSSAGKAKQACYCTKHVIKKSMIPGGPDQRVWVYGPHRTQGNACDGPEHKRVTGWW